MWTSTLELDPAHVIPTKILGRFWRGAYFSSIAPLQVQNLPRQPLPATNWVRVRNTLAGICGSDMQLIFLKGSFSIAPAAIPGRNLSYPGHEVVGEVIEVGDDVTTLRVGDRVVLKNGPNCVTAGVQPLCSSCATDNYILCERANLPGPQPFGGGWSEEMLLHEQQLFRVPSDMNDMQAVLLEPSSVALHAALRRLPHAGEQVLIIGAGTIGLLLLQVIRLLAPDASVSVLARHAFQVEQAARLGAQIIYPQDSYKEVQRITGAQLYQGLLGNKMLLGGYDVIYDTVGSKRTTNDSLRWARAGATVVMVGTHLYRMRVDLTPIWYQEVNLIGANGQGIEYWPLGTDETASTFEIAAELIQQKLLHPEKLITHSFALSDYRNALLTAAHKSHNRAIKVIFDYSKQPPSVVPNVRAARRRQRLDTPVPYTDTRPSQPLTPPDDDMLPPPPTSTPAPHLVPPTPATPSPSTPYAAEHTSTQTPDEGWDDKTIVVSRSHFPRHSTPLQPVESGEPIEPAPPRQFRQPGHFGQIEQVEQARQYEPDFQQQSLNAQSNQSSVDDDDSDTFVDATEKFARIHTDSTPISATSIPLTPVVPSDDEEETATIVTPAQPSPVSDDNAPAQEESANNENEESPSIDTSIPTEHPYDDTDSTANQLVESIEIPPAEATETQETQETPTVEPVEPPPAEASESQETPTEVPFTASPVLHEDSLEIPPPLVPSDTDETGLAMDFMPPSEENAGGQVAMPPWLAALNAETPFTATPDSNNAEMTNEGRSPIPPMLEPVESDEGETTNEGQSPVPPAPEPVESDDPAKTVVVSSSKPRSRRKTSTLKTKNSQKNKQAASSSSPASQEESPVPVVENQPTVTNSTSDTLQGVGEHSTQDGDSTPNTNSE
jgi:threonine dehydrogenase-like Zn-dependent dehydrogenase